MSKHMTVSELIKVLSKIQAKHGDLEISIPERCGNVYTLYSEEDVNYDIFRNKIQLIKID